MFKWLLGALVGGALVYFFDPQQGQKRRDEALGWISSMMEQSPDRLQGIGQAAQDQWQGLSNNVSQRVSQMRTGTGATSGFDQGPNNM
jgi:gas vesicle protein